jgi:hypothetical protein
MVEFFRSLGLSNECKPKKVMVLRDAISKNGACASFQWIKRWDSFAKKDPSPDVQTVINLASDMRERKLAFEPRFPMMT